MERNKSTVIDAQDAVLLGRRMYDEWSRYWPTVEDQPFAAFVNGVRSTRWPRAVDWYNARRLHCTIGMMTPVEYEQAHYAALNREPQPR